MRNRKLPVIVIAATVVLGVAAAQDQGVQAVIGNVFLQNTTPGTVQAGHASIGGTFRAGQVHVSQATATTVPVIGNNTAVGAGSSIGGSFTSSQQSGTGVRGIAVATVGRANGVYGESRSAGGAGVYGKSTTTANFAGDFTAGVLGESSARFVPGVMGYSTVGPGVFGVNWGAKLGGGYYAYVTNQHANVLTVIDPDPNGDDNGTDAAAVGTVLLANSSQGAGPTDGCGGQGVKPLPMTHDGWIQPTCSLSGSGQLSQEVEGWLALLTPEQKDPDGHAHFALPDSFTIEFGRKVEGEALDLLSDDDSRLSLTKFVVPNQLAPPVRFLVEATSPNPAPSSLIFVMDTRASVEGLRQTLELFDLASAAWVEADTRNATLSDSKVSVPVQNLARFVQPGTGRVRSRLSWKPTGPVPNSTWTVGVDQTVWRVG